jgi:hypothetical protein
MVMILLVLSYAFSMNDFLNYFPAGAYEGKVQHDCKIEVVNVSGIAGDVAYQVTVRSAQYPEYPFTLLYDATNKKIVSYPLEKEGKRYSVEWIESEADMSKVRFAYGPDFVEIERVGHFSSGPKIRCTIPKKSL